MKIRIATPSDAKALLEIYTPYVKTTAISFEYEVPTLEEFRIRIENTLKEYPYLVGEDENNQIIGYTYASSFHSRAAYKHCVETSIYVKQEKRQSGVGRTLYTELEKILIKQNVFTLYACVTYTDRTNDSNLTPASHKFHTKMGYTQIGSHKDCGYKFNKWYSIFWYEKQIAPKELNPKPFIPFSKLN